MIIPKPIVPLLKKVLLLARKHTQNDLGLADAIREVDQAEIDTELSRKEALENSPHKCWECGKKYLPLPGDYGFCSIGCRFVGSY